MRFVLMMVFAVCSIAARAQSDIWKRVNPEFDMPQLRSVTPSDMQLGAIARLLRQRDSGDSWGCEGSEFDDMIKGLKFEVLPLAPDHEVLLAQAGAGCARGGQGANGAMWLIRFEGATPVLMASPKDGFNGWLYSIQPSISHGFCDIVLGWHISAAETGLSYFRFNGKSYVAVGSATRTQDDDKGKIISAAK